MYAPLKASVDRRLEHRWCASPTHGQAALLRLFARKRLERNQISGSPPPAMASADIIRVLGRIVKPRKLGASCRRRPVWQVP